MNDSEDIVDHLLTSLKVISMIKEGQKVCVRNGHLSLEVQSTGVLTSLRRWIHKDNRQTTVSYIKSVVQNSISTTKSHNNETSITKLFRGLEESINGINSLTVTYADDATVAATLQVLNDRIKTELYQLNTRDS
jgi:hypothetical protein